ncbi:hypothetical protein HMI49_21465 [Corallococcus exercitus]|uniref:Lipoprotein n=1 Tax=Corallococcus exercitus TaxID=2316736 RepID=A0A7Y4KLE5_9BACT|nr:DUF6068 family protein [Corallococcus exercitus]NOK35772.1 hypothetical protein [Corallococcus exercitus]
MRLRSFQVLLLLSAVLVSGPACVGTKPVPLPPEAAASPWKYARVGDRVGYAFSSSFFNPYIPLDMKDFRQRGFPKEPPGRSNRVGGQMALEVVAVRPPWVWLTITFTDEQGRPHPHRTLAQAIVLPMRMEETQPRPPFEPMDGTVTEERFTAGGRTWGARRIEQDTRVSDGSLEVRVHATEPGPLYLTQGLLEASSQSAGMGEHISYHLKLQSFRQGTLESGEVPTLRHPLGPGTWYDVVKEAHREAPKQVRYCMGAERGQLLTATWTGAPGAAPPCGDLQGASSYPLGEALLGVITQAAAVFPWWPPVLGELKPIRQETITRGAHALPVTVCTQRQGEEGAPESTLQEVQYAVDPWGPELDGLSTWIRFEPLADGTYQVPDQGPPQLEHSTALSDWGVWWKDAGN